MQIRIRGITLLIAQSKTENGRSRKAVLRERFMNICLVRVCKGNVGNPSFLFVESLFNSNWLAPTDTDDQRTMVQYFATATVRRPELANNASASRPTLAHAYCHDAHAINCPYSLRPRRRNDRPPRRPTTVRQICWRVQQDARGEGLELRSNLSHRYKGAHLNPSPSWPFYE